MSAVTTRYTVAVYEPDQSDQPWTVSVMVHAPCMRNLERGIVYDPVTGEAI